MSAACATLIQRTVEACRAGQFVPFFRNRPIGDETVRASVEPGGGLRLEAETALTFQHLRLRQSVDARFDGALRPASCIISAEINDNELRLDLEVGPETATACWWSPEGSRSGTIDLAHPPLLLIDNCFSTHALAAVTALGRASGAGTFLSIPASVPVGVTAPGEAPVMLGGRDYGIPAVTLLLAPGLPEHVWTNGGWASRLVLPPPQIAVEWTPQEWIEGVRS